MKKIIVTIILSISILAVTGIAWSETFNFANGDKYVGELKGNKKHGQGTFTFADGAKYVGEWKDNNRHGQGTETYANGN
ncbi:MAG: hypothetical protein ACI93D_000001, partial [Gammaproteobacteria bacterium]